MQPIELPLSAKLDIGDALQKAKELEKVTSNIEKNMSGAARAAKRFQDRFGGTGGPAAGEGPSSFAGGSPGTKQPTKITASGDFFDKLAKAVLQTRPTTISRDLLSGNLGGLGRTMAQNGVSAVMRGLPGMMDAIPALGPAVGVGGPIAAGAAIASGGLLWLGGQQADLRRQMAVLSSATVGGPALGSAGALTRQSVAYSIAKDMGFDPAQGMNMMQTLAQGGVGFGSISNNLRNSMLLAGPNQLDPNKVAELTATLSTSGGMSAGDINKLYQQLPQIARESGQSLNQLVDSLKVLSKSATGAARDVGGLAAVQHLLGGSSGINAGQLMSPVLGATGANALAASALLGMSPNAFLAAQSSKGGTAQIWDRISGLARQMDQGPSGTFVTEALLQQTGLLDMSSLPANKQADVVRLLAQGKTGQAQALAAQYDKGASVTDAASSYQKAAKSMQDLTSQTDRAKQSLQDFGSALLGWMTTFGGHTSATTAPNTNATTAGGRYSIGNQAAFQGLMSGGRIGNMHGGSYARADQVQAAWAASGGDPRVFSLMLAQMSQESGFDPNAIQKGVPESQRGYGLGQFTATMGAAGLKKYLGSADPSAWHRAALDPNRAMKAMAAYDRDLLAMSGGDMRKAAAMYNGGPKVTSSAYGNAVGGVAQNIEGSLEVTVIHKDNNGKPFQKDRQDVTVRRKAKGHKSHI
jgi:hypothetical protein